MSYPYEYWGCGSKSSGWTVLATANGAATLAIGVEYCKGAAYANGACVKGAATCLVRVAVRGAVTGTSRPPLISPALTADRMAVIAIICNKKAD